MKKQDMILVAVVLILAAILYFIFWGNAKVGTTAVVTVNGGVLSELPLNEDTSFTVQGDFGYNMIEVKDGFVTITDADCRDQICVEHKQIHRVGETIVCLPHKVVIEIVGDGEQAEFDAIVE